MMKGKENKAKLLFCDKLSQGYEEL